MEEEFKPIIGYEELYEISNKGRCRKKINLRGDEFLKPILNIVDKKYVYSLKKDGKTLNKEISLLLATHFLPNPENSKRLEWLDGNKQNYSLDNLKWKSVPVKPIKEKKEKEIKEKKKRGKKTSYLIGLLKNKPIVGFSINDLSTSSFSNIKEKLDEIEVKIYIGEEVIPEDDNPRNVQHITEHFTKDTTFTKEDLDWVNRLLNYHGFTFVNSAKEIIEEEDCIIIKYKR